MIIVPSNDNVSATFQLQQEGKYLEAIQTAHAQLLKAKMNDSTRGMLDAYVDLYYCYFNELLFEDALNVYEAHKQLYVKTSEPYDMMQHYLMSYMLYDMLKQYDDGIAVLKEAIAIATSLNIRYVVGLANCFIGALYTRKKEYALAMDYAMLGVAYIRTFAPRFTFHQLQCEVCLARIYISANALDEAGALIASIEKLDTLPKHEAIYMQFLFIKICYLYSTQSITAAQQFRTTLLSTIAATNDYIIAKALLPTLKSTLTKLELQEELAFWLDYEQSLQALIHEESESITQSFSLQQKTLLHKPDALQKLLTKTQFFERGNALFTTTTKPLLLVLFHLDDNVSIANRSYVQFHILQQVMVQLAQQFCEKPKLCAHFSHNKFAFLFECAQMDYVIQTFNNLADTVSVDLFKQTYTAPIRFAYTTTIASRSSTFLEMYHLVESRLYNIIFR